MRKADPDKKCSFVCQYCGDIVNEYKSKYLKRKRFNCPKEFCVFSAKRNPAELNGQFNKPWTDEKKKRQSGLIKSKVDDEYRHRAGSANRGKKFSAERVKRMNENRTRESYIRAHSDATRAAIGKKSSEKFTVSYLEKVRKTNYASGVWIDPATKSDYEVYKTEAAWVAAMWDIPSIEGIELLRSYGIFNPKTNPLGGCQRSYFLSKRWARSGIVPMYYPPSR